MTNNRHAGWTLVVEWDEDGDDHPWAGIDGPNYSTGDFTHWMPLPQPPEMKE